MASRGDEHHSPLTSLSMEVTNSGVRGIPATFAIADHAPGALQTGHDRQSGRSTPLHTHGW